MPPTDMAYKQNKTAKRKPTVNRHKKPAAFFDAAGFLRII